jgi:hypothetical protein
MNTISLYIVSSGDLILPSYLTSLLAARNGDPDIASAAKEATTQLLAKGSPFERKKLLDANVFRVALSLHNRRSQREQSRQCPRLSFLRLCLFTFTLENYPVPSTELMSLTSMRNGRKVAMDYSYTGIAGRPVMFVIQ